MIQLNKASKIAVLCGGLSSEREVSLRSGKNCYEALHRLGYTQTVLIDADHQVAKALLDQGIEIAFLALHGKYGEDGCIQGTLEFLGIPYTGNRVAASALTMDKDMTKRILKDAGLPVIESTTLHLNNGYAKQLAQLNLAFPLMVKPLLEGSSIGMSKVNSSQELPLVLEKTAQTHPYVMLERFVPGKSITVGVIDIEGKPTVTPILELRTKTEWYDLEAKYTEGLTEFVLPAELPDDVTEKIQQITLAAHQAAGCYGVSRVDFVVDKDFDCYILEINTIPGMTNLSDLPAQANAMGVSYDQLVEYLLQTAVNEKVLH